MERSREHAINSAKTLSQFSPNFIRIRTLVPYTGTPLYEEWERGSFQLLTAHQAMQEVRLLIENLECENTMLLSDHIANYANINGLLPRDKELMLKQLDELLTYPASCFRSPHISRL